MALLRNRGFALLWTGQFLAILADWTLRTAVLIWVYSLTRSGVAVGLVGLAEALPLLLLAPVAGVFVDRWSRAYTMAGAVLARAVLVLPLLAVHTRADLPLILVVTLLVNAASQFFMPAVSAAVPAIVGMERAGQGNSLLQLVNGGIGVIGPGAAALLFAYAGPHGTVVVMGVLYVLAAPVLALVPAPRPSGETARSASLLAEMKDGLAYVRRSRLLVAIIGVAFVALLGVGALSVLDVVFVTRALHQRATDVGILLTSSGVGELAGGIVMAAVSARLARHYHVVLWISITASGLLLIAYALAQTLPTAVVVLFLVGLGYPPILVAFTTMTQLESEDAFMGRVMSLISTGMAVAIIASTASGGVLTDLFGVRQVIGAGATLLIAAGLLSLLTIRATPTPRPQTVPDAQPAALTPATALDEVAR